MYSVIYILLHLHLMYSIMNCNLTEETLIRQRIIAIFRKGHCCDVIATMFEFCALTSRHRNQNDSEVRCASHALIACVYTTLSGIVYLY